MADDKETAPSTEVAPQEESAQAEQVASTEKEAEAPETAAETAEEKLYAGKFKSPDDLEKSYEESQSKLTQLAQENARLKNQQAPEETGYPNVPPPPTLDEESNQAVRSAAREEYFVLREREKEREFTRKHPELKEDKVLANTIRGLIREANEKGEYMDQEDAYGQAQKLLDEKIKPVQKQASQEGFQEGKDIAKKKEQLGEVGSSNYKEPEVSDDDLSAADIAKKYKLPRV